MASHRRGLLIAVVSLLAGAAVIYVALRPTRHVAYAPPIPPDAVDATGTAAPRPQPASLPQNVCRDFYAAACGRRDITADPTGVVQPDIKGEVEALRLYEQIIHDHPDWTSDEVDEELVRLIYTAKRRQRLKSTFDWVATALKSWIDRQPEEVFPPPLKKRLKARIDSTKLELPPPASVYAKEPDLFTKNEIYYESRPGGKRTVRVGGAYLLSAKSWFNRVFTFAHELAHAIDPCEIEAAKIDIPAYGRLARCFRRTGFIRGPAGCGARTQFGEAFADWVATDVVATALTSYVPALDQPTDRLHSAVNAVRDLCSQESWEEFETEIYPDPAKRIGLIFVGNPRIAEFLGCAPKTYYCSLEGK